jgi:ComEC/Rec2-related protein
MKIRFHHKHPLAFAAAFLVLGAVLPTSYLIVLFVLAVGAFVLKQACWREVTILFLSVLLGCFSKNHHLRKYQQAQDSLAAATAVSIVIEFYDKKSYGFQVKARTLEAYTHSTGYFLPDYQVNLRSKDTIGFEPGTVLLIQGFQYNRPEMAHYPFEFNQKSYFLGSSNLGNLDIRKARIYLRKRDVASAENRRFAVKLALRKRVQTYLSARGLALFEGLIIGDKNGISSADTQLFQQAGLMHILSVSGMHLGLIYWLLAWPIKQLAKRKKFFRTAEIGLLPLIWAYAYLTGMAPPVFRAAAFVSAMVGARILGNRRVRLADILASAACCQVILDPLTLYSVSFQLSFAAMLGLAFWFPFWQEAWEKRVGSWVFWGDLLGMSLCCTLTTLPLTLYHFHAIPTWFLLGNLVFTLPFTALIYAFVALSVLVFLPLDALTHVLAYGCEWLVGAIHWALFWESRLPLPYLYAYDFRFVDALLFTLIIYACWRRVSLMSKFSWRYVQSIFFLWLLWGLIRVPLNSFSGEVVSRRFTISKALAAGRWAQSQKIDTLFYGLDITHSPKEMGKLSNRDKTQSPNERR